MPNTSAPNNFDPSKAEKFSGRMLTALNNAALCLMISVGHRTGLLDVLSTLPPSTSAELATAAKLNERYVREWLGAMVTARVVGLRCRHRAFFLASRTCRVSDEISRYQ